MSRAAHEIFQRLASYDGTQDWLVTPMAFEEDRRTYEDAAHSYDVLKNLVRDRIAWELEKADITVQTIYGRVKSFRSYHAKLHKSSTSTHDGVQITDIVGVRVVCLFLSQLDEIHHIIHDVFNVQSEDRKIDDVAPDTFGYQSNHYVVRLRESYRGTDEWFVDGLLCEIQVRTLAMEAWASVSHALAYTSPQELPTDLRRDLHALSAVLYVADRQFQRFFEAIDALRTSDSNTSADESDFFLHELDLDALRAILNQRYRRYRQPDREAAAAFLTRLKLARFKLVGPFIDALEAGRSKSPGMSLETYELLQRSDAAYVAAHDLSRADWLFSSIFWTSEEERWQSENERQEEYPQPQSDPEQPNGPET